METYSAEDNQGMIRDEYVKLSDESVECICGNTTHGQGFYSCDMQGNEVEPDIYSAWGDYPLWCCDSCGRIISESLEQVIGVRKDVYTYL